MGFMLEWENTMREAKEAFNNKVFSVAIFLNKQALDLASERFDENVKIDAEKSVAAVMVSYFSLVDSYVEIRDFKQAYNIYQRSFDFLNILMSTTYKSSNLESAVSHAISHLKNEWGLFYKNHKDELKTMTTLLPNEFQSSLNTLMSSHSSVIH